MDLRTAGLLFCLPSLCVGVLAAETRPWWDSAWRCRTTVTRPQPSPDDVPCPVEVTVDFQALLQGLGQSGAVDPSSLRVIDPRTAAPVPHVVRPPRPGPDHAPGLRLAWMDRPAAGVASSYDLYFDTLDRGHAAPSYAAADLPPENLLVDPDFERLGEDPAGGWAVSAPGLVQPGRWARTTGQQSLCIRVDADAAGEAPRELVLTQAVDVARYAGREVLFEADFLAERAAYGVPALVEIRQFRADGTAIAESAIDPRWLALELAEGQLVQFSQRGRLRHDAARAVVAVSLGLRVTDADTGQTVRGPDAAMTVWIDRLTLRPEESWPWPALSHAGFVEGALTDTPHNRAVEFTGQRRLMFNGASEGTLLANDPGRPDSVHWGLERGTLEFWCRPIAASGDGRERVFFEGIAYGHRRQSCLRLRADGQLEFSYVDSAGKTRSVAGPVAFEAGIWRHLAATWDLPAGRLGLFVDGRPVAALAGTDAPWPFSLTESNEALQSGRGIGERDRRSLPMQAFLGGDRSWQAGRGAEAVIDECRISDSVRYTDAFAPARTAFTLDANTRALFHLDHDPHGTHAADDRFVRGHLACELAPQLDTATVEQRTPEGVVAREVAVRPNAAPESFEANRAERRLPARRPFTTPPDPRFTGLYERQVERLVTPDNAGAGFDLEVGGDAEPWMRCTTFEPAADAPGQTLLPRWRANDRPVPFSVADLAATVAPTATSDAERAMTAFRYALETTNYYDANYCETLPGGRHRNRVSYSLIKALNIYPMDQCGPMNHMLRKLFLAVGISSTNASGTHHQFQQAFYDGDMRLFDLSSRVYWLDRDNQSVIGRRDLEEDPWLKLRQGGDANAWLRGRRSGAGLGGAERPHSMDFPLRRGERISVGWHNEGRWFELSDRRAPIPLAKIPPFFGNGAVLFEPVTASPAQTLENLAVETDDAGTALRTLDAARPGTLEYRLLCPYILADGAVQARYRDAAPGALRLALSVDDGATWQVVWTNTAAAGDLACTLRDQVSARYAYAARLEIPAGAVVEGLRLRSTFVVSPWALPGRLRRGRNAITFVGGPVTAPVRTTCAWIERRRSGLGLSLNALGFYLDSDQMHRQVCVVTPGQDLALQVTLSGRLPDGTAPDARRPDLIRVERLPQGWTARNEASSTPERADIAIRPDGLRDGDIASVDLCLAEGDDTRRLPVTVLAATAALVAEAESAADITGDAAVADLPEASGARVVSFTGEGALRYALRVAQAGRHALWIRARWDAEASTAITLQVDQGPARAVTAAAMIGFTDWTAPRQAHTKMFAHYGENYAHGSWYRVPDLDLEAGEHALSLTAQAGAHLDALLVLPQNDVIDRAAMNLFMNWNYAPWRNPW
ncbi:MAG: LamG domain-containing protein [Lentisphaerae bacterium]|nr:LamG domain-containing protein [Lentisphaerota bacterium]